MKKIASILILLFPYLISFSQNGNGTQGDPFRGTINGNVQWTINNPAYGSTVYIGTPGNPDLTVGTGGNLVIDPGITVIFTQLTSDLLVTGSGILNAAGTPSERILFTRDPGIAHWGHISFETPGTGTPITGTGTFAYCTVEYGYAVASGTLPGNAGGGIQVNANGVTISHCIIRNNYSNFGGGITVNAGRNTIIRNTLFSSNTSNEAGGALLIWSTSTALVENCIFENNLARGTSAAGYGGGGIWLLTNTSRIVNCTFSNNTSPRPGDAIYSYNSPNARIINSVFWGSDDQFGGSANTSTIVTSAFQNTKPSQAGNSIIINSVNDAVNGPNFADPSNNDWNISFVSPLRNSGSDSYPGVTIPQTDFPGNPKIGNKDIGAYEAQYSHWTGAVSNSWGNASNWESNILPVSGSSDVIIPSAATNYPTAAPGPDFTIGTGRQIILDPGARATLGTLANNGSLQMRAGATGLSSLIMNSYTKGTGSTENLQLYLSGGYIGDPEYNEGRWHYISSPVQGTSTDIFTEYIFDLARWVDGIQGESMREGWVAYDGYAYLIDDPSSPPASWFGYPYRFNSMNLGQGYNYFRDENASYSISGQLNTSDVQVQLKYAGQSEEANGWNLVGNPFTSGLDWDYISSNTPFPPNTSHSIQFTKDNELFYYVAGVMVPDIGLPPTSVIPPMQGFFVKTYQNNVVLNLPAAARTNDAIPQRYKGSYADIPLIRLSISDTSSSDETVVRFAEDAKTGNDYEYDALKMFIPTNKVAIYTISNGKKYAVNGQPYPAEGSILEIPLTVAVYATGEHSINIKAVQGLDGYSVTLTDLLTSTVTDLKNSGSVIFTTPNTGFINNRFVLKVSTSTTGIEDPKPEKAVVKIWQALGMINILPEGESWNGQLWDVRITNLAGMRIHETHNVMLSGNSLLQVPAPAVKGLYLVEIRSGSKKFVGKVIVK